MSIYVQLQSPIDSLDPFRFFRKTDPQSIWRKVDTLERACWLYGVAGNTIFGLPFIAMLITFTSDMEMPTLLHAYFVCFVVYTVWAFFKIWACTRIQNTDWRLAVAARAYVILGSFQIVTFLGIAYLRQITLLVG
ncbi:MAG: hypothetical protein HN580_25620 [Deltaproteobacteria bacterium]|nr:hypothetical protein [Deltaproteobacteria bacterium]